MHLARLLLASCLLGAGALDAKWTPNGEAPAPFSTKARQEMGIDPTAFAGQAQGQPLAPPARMLPFNLGCLVRVPARRAPLRRRARCHPSALAPRSRRASRFSPR
jgi:hypothetical protein